MFQGAVKHRCYIAAQGPKEPNPTSRARSSTVTAVADFWQMVVEQNVNVVIMLADFFVDGEVSPFFSIKRHFITSHRDLSNLINSHRYEMSSKSGPGNSPTSQAWSVGHPGSAPPLFGPSSPPPLLLLLILSSAPPPARTLTAHGPRNTLPQYSRAVVLYLIPLQLWYSIVVNLVDSSLISASQSTVSESKYSFEKIISSFQAF